MKVKLLTSLHISRAEVLKPGVHDIAEALLADLPSGVFEKLEAPKAEKPEAAKK